MRLAHHMLTWSDWYAHGNRPLDVPAMLAQVAEAGYDGIEVFGAEPLLGPAAALRRALADAGLDVAACGSFVDLAARAENTRAYRADLDYAAELGVTTIMVCGGFPANPRRTAFDDDYLTFADNLAATQEYAAGNGQTVAFHPHLGCIVETDDEVERLLRHIPSLQLCIDTGHLAAVRVDPAALARRHPHRVAHTHLKDYHAGEASFAELGHGDVGLDFADYLDALDDIGYDGWLVVERDAPRIPAVDSARLSRAHLASIRPEWAHHAART